MPDKPQPYKISVPGNSLDDLKQRLSLARFPTQIESPDQDPWDFGAPAEEVQRLATYWKDGFDWRKAEAKLNELPQYNLPIEVDGFGVLDIHCEYPCPTPSLIANGILTSCVTVVHQVSPVKNAIPLLFSHGCKYG